MSKSLPIPSATILMLRDGAEGLEVFMVVRHHEIDFASGALVFPGGKLAVGDDQVSHLCQGASNDETEIDYQVGAIREAFEECGILLAREKGETELIGAPRLATLEHYRKPLAHGELTIEAFLEAESLELACDRLEHYAHWVTPAMMPKRFDTQFYLAKAPSDHLAVHDGYESVDSIWIKPENALEGAKSGEFTIIFPTRLNIEMLGNAKTTAEAFAQARERKVVTVEPRIEQREDGNYLCLPIDAGYSITEEKM
ncbi:MAG: 8-oxo-dGTP pyrophosphatase MutT (NUDIX family) [Candidatus Azotimanducaceae bacterium]|jgi:8-oxo-dGTP pyrophosphatase MutT (NUDIX family)